MALLNEKKKTRAIADEISLCQQICHQLARANDFNAFALISNQKPPPYLIFSASF